MTAHRAARIGFGRNAAGYERARPEYQGEAVAWLAGQLDLRAGRTVLDVAAGTGKLTRALVATGAEVVAVEPVPEMRAVLERLLPDVRSLEGTAEALPVRGCAFDAVVVGQAFHWFAGGAALAEFHRVLRPGGRLGLVWNRRRVEEPLHRALSEIIEPYRGDEPAHRGDHWREALERTALFAPVAEHRACFEQALDTAGLIDRVASTSFIAALGEAQRAEVRERVGALAATHPHPLRLGYLSELCVYARR